MNRHSSRHILAYFGLKLGLIPEQSKDWFKDCYIGFYNICSQILAF